MCVRVNVRCVWVAFMSCCFACACVLELVVCRVRFARVSCPWLRFGVKDRRAREVEKRRLRAVQDLTQDLTKIVWGASL